MQMVVRSLALCHYGNMWMGVGGSYFLVYGRCTYSDSQRQRGCSSSDKHIVE